MSTSLLYHAFGLKGVEFQSTKFVGSAVILSAKMTNKFIKCPVCSSRHATLKGQKKRWFKMSPLGRKQSLLKLQLHRLKCIECSTIWWPQLPFTNGKHRYTRSFALTALDLLRFGTIKDIANYLHVGWDLIKDIHKSKLQRLYRKMPIHKLKYLGIDEFSIRKGHKYMTIFIDLKEGRIIHAVEGTSKEKIQPFLKILARKAKNLKAVAMDMSRSFSSAVTECLPKADIVFDRYHIMANVNMAIDELRREQQRPLADDDRTALKGCRFMLLRNYHALTPDYKVKLDSLFEINKPLFKMHAMKEQLRLFWGQLDRKRALAFLIQWCFDALMSEIKPLVKVALTLVNHKKGILNYFPHRITSAAVEGTVNKIKTLKRQAYGFRDMEYFKLRLYHLHCQGYSLSG
jgi:transposase